MTAGKGPLGGKAAKRSSAKAEKPAPLSALVIEKFKVNEHCVGSRWTVANTEQLARLIAIIAMGQATHAARIIGQLQPPGPALNVAALREDAKARLTVSGKDDDARKAARWHRDGLIFEAISWIAAQQGASGDILLKDPHISATTQGLDGLMIELDDTGEAVVRATIFEDKCSKAPRKKFREEVLPAFKSRHVNQRAAELVAAAATLISSRMHGSAATKAAGRVLDRKYRAYRAGLTIDEGRDSQTGRRKLFKGYDDLDGITDEQRIGATFVTPGELRAWFDGLAKLAIIYLEELGEGEE